LWRVYTHLLPDYDEPDFLSAVHSTFTVEPSGSTLGDVALETGAWGPAA